MPRGSRSRVSRQARPLRCRGQTAWSDQMIHYLIRAVRHLHRGNPARDVASHEAPPHRGELRQAQPEEVRGRPRAASPRGSPQASASNLDERLHEHADVLGREGLGLDDLQLGDLRQHAERGLVSGYWTIARKSHGPITAKVRSREPPSSSMISPIFARYSGAFSNCPCPRA